MAQHTRKIIITQKIDGFTVDTEMFEGSSTEPTRKASVTKLNGQFITTTKNATVDDIQYAKEAYDLFNTLHFKK